MVSMENVCMERIMGPNSGGKIYWPDLLLKSMKNIAQTLKGRKNSINKPKGNH